MSTPKTVEKDIDDSWLECRAYAYAMARIVDYVIQDLPRNLRNEICPNEAYRLVVEVAGHMFDLFAKGSEYPRATPTTWPLYPLERLSEALSDLIGRQMGSSDSRKILRMLRRRIMSGYPDDIPKKMIQKAADVFEHCWKFPVHI
jgi:hypothetical protein